ncbi:MAG: polyphenol oxidase family protein, partial [Streptosporangiaceae bacterium]
PLSWPSPTAARRAGGGTARPAVKIAGMTAPPVTSCELRQQGDLRVLSWPALASRGAQVMVTTRHGGVSAGPYATLNLSFSVGDDADAVLENRRRVAAALGGDPGEFVFARQVHGGAARVVSAADAGRGTLSFDDAIGPADAMVTNDPRVVLAILVGDCVPIVLYDPVARVLACVHAGWRGTAAGVTQAALTAMAGLGSRPANVLAGLGPAIAPDRYQVGDDVREAITACLGDAAASVLAPDDAGRWLLDLWAANTVLLARAGVPESQIHAAAIPTGGLFFSDRTARPCGRFALVARLTARGATASQATDGSSR